MQQPVGDRKQRPPRQTGERETSCIEERHEQRNQQLATHPMKDMSHNLAQQLAERRPDADADGQGRRRWWSLGTQRKSPGLRRPLQSGRAWNIVVNFAAESQGVPRNQTL